MHPKINYVLFSLLLGMSSLYGQKKQAALEDAVLSTEQVVYRRALGYGDAAVARQACYRLIALGARAYRDTLAYLYTLSGESSQALAVLQPLIEEEESAFRQELLATNYWQLSAYKKGAEAYEKLQQYPKMRNARNLYYLADCQLALERHLEFEATRQAFEALQDSAQVIVRTGERAQLAPAHVGFMHLRALHAIQQKDYPLAMELYQSILQIQPEMWVARQNLKSLQAALKNGSSEENTDQETSQNSKS